MGRPRKLTPIEEMSVYQEYQEKLPLAEIAYHYKISVTTVLRIVKREQEKERYDK